MRPFPSNRIQTTEALTFGAMSGLTGVGMLYSLTNPLVAGLGAANIFLYAVPYTLSKPRSEYNTWVGAVVGAIPPMMGWAAATESLYASEPFALAAILFLWQFPHFFALSWMYREDYRRGGFQMVPCNDPTGQRTASLIMRYSLYSAAFPLATSMAGLTSYMFAVEGTILNLALLYLANNFRRDQSNGHARKIFLYSLVYLPLLLGGYVFHSRMWSESKGEEQVSTIYHLALQRTAVW